MLYLCGYGLSYLYYTQTIKSVTVDRSVNGNITAVVEVKNNSNQDGKFLTQLYVQQPYTDYDRTNLVEKSAVMFLNSAKVDVAAGKSKEVTITISHQVSGERPREQRQDLHPRCGRLLLHGGSRRA